MQKLLANYLDKHDAVNRTAKALTKRGLSFIAAPNLHKSVKMYDTTNTVLGLRNTRYAVVTEKIIAIMASITMVDRVLSYHRV